MAILKRIMLGAVAMAGFSGLNASEAATCIGNCGTVSGVFTGSVTPAPTGNGSYDWVSTSGGVLGAGQIAGYSASATNGSELTSDSFFGKVGQKVSFYFNYITSDGAGFADYGFAQLINTTTNKVVNLFTARTKPSGTIAPGLELPAVEATLTPGSVPIIPGAPTWSPLGGYSGACYSTGCGYTGWIQSDYEITEAGSYQLRFGASNWSDQIWDSGLAFSGLVLDGNTIGNGSSFESPLLPSEIDPQTGAFHFEFTAQPNVPVVIDPEIATGYTFNSNIGILSAEFEDLGDSQYTLTFLDALGDTIVKDITPGSGNIFDFSAYDPSGVISFTVTGIDEFLMLDPTSTTAFKTKLTFAVTGDTVVNISQQAIKTWVAGGVPETSTWAMLILGVGAVGAMMRRKTALQLAANAA